MVGDELHPALTARPRFPEAALHGTRCPDPSTYSEVAWIGSVWWIPDHYRKHVSALSGVVDARCDQQPQKALSRLEFTQFWLGGQRSCENEQIAVHDETRFLSSMADDAIGSL